jgi:simple sugar transport system ATP-binding protein
MRYISKSFPGVQALQDVDFTLQAGEIHALLGQNGAGKSTLIKVLTGVYRRDSGDILLAGQSIAPHSPREAQTLGISTVYQEVNLIPHLSVAENIFLGRQPMRLRRIDWRRMNAQAEQVVRPLDLCLDVTQPLSSYSIAIQQMVAIARALSIDARVLILDEPTSSLDAHETARLFEVMRGLRGRGLGIVFITHFIEQVYAISDRLTILRNGRCVGQFETACLPRLELVARMIGKDVQAIAQMAVRRPAAQGAMATGGAMATRGAMATLSVAMPEATATPAPPLLRARQLGRCGSLSPVDLRIDCGEVVGLAGLLGSGRTELARLLFGIDRADSGVVEIEGRTARLTSPRQAIARGLGFCPEDRKTEGLLPALSVRENIILALQAGRGWWRALSRRAQQSLADHYIRALGIATPDAERPVAQLSGGNQQKVILARWLASQPRLLILDEPTRGIDVGAKAEIERLVADLSGQGIAILFISSELEEVVRNCHRVAVLRDRAKVGELALDRPGASQGLADQAVRLESIMRMIAGTPADG